MSEIGDEKLLDAPFTHEQVREIDDVACLIEAYVQLLKQHETLTFKQAVLQAENNVLQTGLHNTGEGNQQNNSNHVQLALQKKENEIETLHHAHSLLRWWQQINQEQIAFLQEQLQSRMPTGSVDDDVWHM